MLKYFNITICKFLKQVLYAYSCFSLVTNTWTRLSPTGDVPEARTAHAGSAVEKNLFIFGGMSGIGSALDDFYMLNTGITTRSNTHACTVHCH